MQKEDRKMSDTQKVHSKQALAGSRVNVFLMDPQDLVLVGLDDSNQDAALFDPRVLTPPDESLVLNIMVYGVIKPVVVRKNGDGAPEVVDGRQRVKAAREANKRLVAEGKEPVKVRVMPMRADDSNAFGVMLAGNIHLDDTALGKAQKAAKFMAMGRTEEEVAIAHGVSVSTVRNWLKLLDLAPEVQTAIADNKISPSAALGLGHLDRADQAEALDEALGAMATPVAGAQPAEESDATRPTVADVKKIARRKRAPKKQQKAPLKPIIRGLIDANSVENLGLDPTLILAFRWVMGDLETDEVPGLAEAIDKIDEAVSKFKEQKKVKANAARLEGRRRAAEARKAAADTQIGVEDEDLDENAEDEDDEVEATENEVEVAKAAEADEADLPPEA
jgi:ParB family chromosome partitioning protein